MKMMKMHQNALICIGMRMLKNNTTFVKKQHISPQKDTTQKWVSEREMHASRAWCRAPDATGACPET